MSDVNTVLTKTIRVEVHSIEYNNVHKKKQVCLFVYGVPDEPQVMHLREGDSLNLQFPLTLNGKVA